MASNAAVTYDFVAGTAAVADQVDTNFQNLVDWVNTNAIHLDGSKAFTGVPSGPTGVNPSTADQLARKAYVDATVPVGTVSLFAGSVAPSASYLLCQGQAVSRSTYSTLFSLVSTTYGVGDGSTTFNLPNLKGRVPVGLDTGQTEFDVLGETGGLKTTTLTEANLPPHPHTAGTLAASAHSITDAGHSHTPSGGWDNFVVFDTGGPNALDINAGSGATVTSVTNTSTNTTGITIGNHTISGSTGNGAGTAAAVNNLQPYLVMNYIIKAL